MELLPDPNLLLDPPELPEIPLPKGWSEHTLLAVLHVIALARIVVLNVANWPSDSECDGLRLRCENDRLRGEIEMLKKELDIKNSRFSRLEPKRRPHYTPEERLEIRIRSTDDVTCPSENGQRKNQQRIPSTVDVFRIGVVLADNGMSGREA